MADFKQYMLFTRNKLALEFETSKGIVFLKKRMKQTPEEIVVSTNERKYMDAVK
jgi:hypothetical protein